MRDPIRWLPQYSYVIFQIVDEVVHVKNVSKLAAESDKIGQFFWCLILGWKIINTKTHLYKSKLTETRPLIIPRARYFKERRPSSNSHDNVLRNVQAKGCFWNYPLTHVVSFHIESCLKSGSTNVQFMIRATATALIICHATFVRAHFSRGNGVSSYHNNAPSICISARTLFFVCARVIIVLGVAKQDVCCRLHEDCHWPQRSY